MSRQDRIPPPGGGGSNQQFAAAKVKVEQTLAEKIYIMLHCSDSMKLARPQLFPSNGPQHPTILNRMFAPPDKKMQRPKNKSFYDVLITNIRQVEMGSREALGLSAPIKRMYIKQSEQETVETSNSIIGVQGAFVMRACLYLRVQNVHLLVLDPSHLLKYETLGTYLKNIRYIWYAMNLLRFPTSPQVAAAQIVRNHARLFSDIKSVDTATYHHHVQSLIRECTGIERALVPEQNMDANSHMRMSWYRIRRRVLERMIEEVNKMKPEDEKKFLIPFGIKTIPQLLAEIQSQMAICDSLWMREKAGEIILSDGPDMEDEEMNGGGEYSGGQIDRDRGYMMEQPQLVQQPMSLVPSLHNIPTGAQRLNLNQYYNGMQQQPEQRRNMQARGKGGDTLASVLDRQMPNRGLTRGQGEGGRSVPPQTTPLSGMDRTTMKGIRRDTHQQYFVDGAGPSRAPSSSIRPPPRTVPVPLPTATTTTVPPTTNAQEESPSVSRPSPQQPLPPHSLAPLQSRVVGGSGMGMGQPAFSPLLASRSPHLLVEGPNGMYSPLPSVVYVQQTEQGLVEVMPPSPQHQFILTIPSMEGRERGRDRASSRRSLPSHSVKRRHSRSKQVVKKRRTTLGENGDGRRKTYEDSGDASSDDTTDEEDLKHIKARKARIEKYAKERKEKEEMMKMEQLKRKEEDEKEDKEDEEEIRKNDEEAKRKEDEERKKRKEAERIESEKARKETTGVVVLAVDSGDESGEERAVASEDEVVPASIAAHSDEELTGDKNMENNSATCAVGTTAVVGDNSNMETNNEEVIAVGGVSVPPPVLSVPSVPSVPPLEERDSDIEYLYSVARKEKPHNKEYSEEGLRNMKKELDEMAANNGIIVLKHVKPTTGSSTSVARKNRGTLNGWIDGQITVKGETGVRSENTVTTTVDVPPVVPPVITSENKEKEGVKTPVKSEIGERSTVEERSGESDSDQTNDTAMTVIKSEVKTEVKEEKKDEEDKEDEEEENNYEEGEEEEGEDEEEEEAETTIIERRSEQIAVPVEEKEDVQMEDVMNQSAELFDEEEEEAMEDTEGRRSVLEAMTQEEGSQVPFTVVHSDVSTVIDASLVVTTTTVSTVSTVCPPVDTPSSQSVMDTTPVSIPSTVPIVQTVQTTPQETTEDSPQDKAVPVSVSPSPRSAPIRVPSQQTDKTSSQSTGLTPMPTRHLSEEMIKMLKRTDSLLSPYEKRMEEMQGRVKRRGDSEKKTGDKEKEKEVVEVINDEPELTEMDNQVVRFHVKRGDAAVLSEDRRCATRDESIDSYCNAVVFTNRPLSKGEKIILKVTEISPGGWRSRIRFGLTTKNPMEYTTRKDIPKQLTNHSEDGHVNYLFDSGVMNTVKLDSLLGLELSEGGEELRYSFDGVEMGVMQGELPVHRPLWLSVDIYGSVKGIEISTPLQTTEEAQPPVDAQDEETVEKESTEELIEEEKKEEEDKEVVCLTPPSSPVVSQVEEETENMPMETEGVCEKRDTLLSPVEDISPLAVVPYIPLPLLTLPSSPIETSEDTVEDDIDERKEETTVAVIGDGGEGMKEGEDVAVDEVREEEGTTTEVEPVMESVQGDKEEEEEAQKETIVEKRSIERNEEEEEEPPIKKIRIEIESAEVVMENEGHEKTNEKEEEGSETPSVVSTIELIEEEVKEVAVPVLRRRSLFGPGCLPFDRTMDAKNDKEEEKENEEEMEVDEEKEEEDTFSIRRFSLFGPGSASFTSLIHRMTMKKN